MSSNQPRFLAASLSSTTTPALTTSYAVRPAYADGTVMAVANQSVGNSATQTFFASVTQTAPGTMTAITLKAQVSFDGANSTTATAANWTDVIITNLATGVTAIEHTLTGVDGATACATYGTESGRNAPYMRVCVKSVTANAAAGESATVYVVAS
tara:strand:+ start:187 stop:651 length:465 start_codon:yes stop_codon:yes gene_type:complete